MASEFKNRAAPNVIYAVYTDYDSNENSEYAYFIGEKVESLDDQDLSKFKTIVISAGTYQKFTTESGSLPKIVIDGWQKIWQMDSKELEGDRNYLADFEIYDQRAAAINEAEVDIYIGVL